VILKRNHPIDDRAFPCNPNSPQCQGKGIEEAIHHIIISPLKYCISIPGFVPTIAPEFMKILLSVLRLFFSLLYHQFAWTYGPVSFIVSLGRWNGWVKSVLPYLDGRVLEIGYGPGLLQQSLNGKKVSAFGLDESRQMARRASHLLKKKKYPVRLTRGYAQALPFNENSFTSVVATFPSEYIFDPETLKEIHRVLAPGGKLVVLPSAWITGTSFVERVAAWLFEITGQTGAIDKTIVSIKAIFTGNGFIVRHEILEHRGSKVLVVIATRPTAL
jgi:ubiquinone/menaquinone biosynthesis C-methylase UbiE